MEFFGVNRIAVIALSLLAIGAHPADAATLQFTEVHHAAAGSSLPDYVEVHYSGITAFDLVVFNATIGNTNKVLSVTSVTPSAANNTVVVHFGEWPAASPFNGQRVRDDELTLGGIFPGLRLILFDGPSGIDPDFVFNDSSFNDWPEPSEAVATEMVELIYNPSIVGPAPGDFGSIGQTFTFDLDNDEAIFRHIAAGDYLSTFSVGATTGDTTLPDGQSLNPTFVNFMTPTGEDSPPAHMPAPGAGATAIMALLGWAAVRSARAGRSTRRPSAPRR